MTIASIRKKLQEFNKASSSDPAALQSAWSKIFKTDLSNKSANAFADYYRNMRPSKLMRSDTKKQRGGASALNPAPLTYETVPGANVAVYGRFPVEAGTDMPSIHNMDVYFQNSLTSGCGVQDSSLRVPVDMGSNKVGGRRTGRSKRSNARKTYRKRNNRKAPNGTMRRRRDRKRGGSLLESIGMRPYMATPPPNPVQLASNSWSGVAAPVSGRPEIPAWNYRSSGIDGLINPGMVSHIGSDFNKLASPSPWQTAN